MRLSCRTGPSGSAREEVPWDALSPDVLMPSQGGPRGGGGCHWPPALRLSAPQMVRGGELAGDALAGPPFLAQFTEPRGARSLRLRPALPRRPAAQPGLMEPGWVSPRERPVLPASGEGAGSLSRRVASSTPAPQTLLHTHPQQLLSQSERATGASSKASTHPYRTRAHAWLNPFSESNSS